MEPFKANKRTNKITQINSLILIILSIHLASSNINYESFRRNNLKNLPFNCQFFRNSFFSFIFLFVLFYLSVELVWLCFLRTLWDIASRRRRRFQKSRGRRLCWRWISAELHGTNELVHCCVARITSKLMISRPSSSSSVIFVSKALAFKTHLMRALKVV